MVKAIFNGCKKKHQSNILNYTTRGVKAPNYSEEFYDLCETVLHELDNQEEHQKEHISLDQKLDQLKQLSHSMLNSIKKIKQ